MGKCVDLMFGNGRVLYRAECAKTDCRCNVIGSNFREISTILDILKGEQICDSFSSVDSSKEKVSLVRVMDQVESSF